MTRSTSFPTRYPNGSGHYAIRSTMKKSATENTTARRGSRAMTALASGTSESSGVASGRPSLSARKGKTKPISAGDTPKNAVTEKRSAEIDPKTLSTLRRLPNSDVRNLILGALKWGVRHRLTRSGIMLYGENGKSASIHFSVSDTNANKQITRDLKALGYDPGRK